MYKSVLDLNKGQISQPPATSIFPNQEDRVAGNNKKVLANIAGITPIYLILMVKA